MARFNRGQQAARSNSISSAARGATNSANTSKTDPGGAKFVQKYLDDCRSFYSCIYCRTHLANHDELISRSFQGNRSRAYLFNSVVNVSCGPSVQRELNTGAHSVADIFCANCETTIGWKYEKAFVDSQRYKEGKYIIELAHVVRENRHLELDKRDVFLGLVAEHPPQPQPSQQQATASKQLDATISHGGSLSPGSSAGQWSPGTSSTSSSSSSNDDARPSCLFASTGHQQEADPRRQLWLTMDDEDDVDEIEDDDVLMFPFNDDFYGNRSSYSNLSTSRSCQKRSRHSFHSEAPYDWRRAHVAGSSSSSSISPTATEASAGPRLTNHQQQERAQPGPSSGPVRRSSDSIEIPQAQAGLAPSASNST